MSGSDHSTNAMTRTLRDIQPRPMEIVGAAAISVAAVPVVIIATGWIRAATDAAPLTTTIPTGTRNLTLVYHFHTGLTDYAWPLCVLSIALFLRGAALLWQMRRRTGSALIAGAGAVVAVLLASAVDVWQQANSCLGTRADPCRVDLTTTGHHSGRALFLLGVCLALSALSLVLLLRTHLEQRHRQPRYRIWSDPH